MISLWHKLKLCIGAAFKGSSTNIIELFHWSDQCKDKIFSGKWYKPIWSDENKRSQADIELAQKQLIAYSFELAYELAIGKKNCVSVSIGYEGPINVHGMIASMKNRTRSRSMLTPQNRVAIGEKKNYKIQRTS